MDETFELCDSYIYSDGSILDNDCSGHAQKSPATIFELIIDFYLLTLVFLFTLILIVFLCSSISDLVALGLFSSVYVDFSGQPF